MKKWVSGLIGFMLFIWTTGGASAALLGVTQAFPDMLSNSIGQVTYDSTSGLFSYLALPEKITISPSPFPGIRYDIMDTTSASAPFYPSNSFQLQFLVNPDGTFGGGVPGPDLQVWGKVNFTYNGITYNTDGLLLSAEVTQFGYSNNRFEWVGNSVAGPLAALFNDPLYGIAGDISVTVLGNYAGNFENSFTTGYGLKGDTYPVPEPATILLFGSALVGLGHWGKKRFRS